MRTTRALVVVALVLTGCGGDSGGGGSVPAVDGEAAEKAYAEAYNAAWVKSCRAAVTAIRKNAPRRAAAVSCEQPVEQMEGNTSFDPEQARLEGRQHGTFDGCAYAWDEAYAAGGDVQPRC